MYALFTTALTLFAAVQAAPTASNSAFSLMALRSASPLHFQSVNANGGKFWILKDTATYCPADPATCDSTTKNVTALVCSSGSCSMNAIVPGGQRVFVNPADGTLGFTQAHSASMPAGALTSIFTQKDGYLSTSKGGFVACPDGQGHYAVKVALKGKDTSKCLGFNAKTIETKAQAWQYT